MGSGSRSVVLFVPHRKKSSNETGTDLRYGGYGSNILLHPFKSQLRLLPPFFSPYPSEMSQCQERLDLQVSVGVTY